MARKYKQKIRRERAVERMEKQTLDLAAKAVALIADPSLSSEDKAAQGAILTDKAKKLKITHANTVEKLKAA